MLVCPSCGRENGNDAGFCSGRATPLETAVAAREERKVVTILFCDRSVGATRYIRECEALLAAAS